MLAALWLAKMYDRASALRRTRWRGGVRASGRRFYTPSRQCREQRCNAAKKLNGSLFRFLCPVRSTAYGGSESIAPSNYPSRRLRRTGDRCWRICRRSRARRS